jgi:hypothetical protein
MLAFFGRVGNNPFGTAMRLACGLAIALGLSFPPAGMACSEQDPAGSADGRRPAAPTPKKDAPAETAPAEKASPGQVPADGTPASGKSTSESVRKKKIDAGSPIRTRKLPKRTTPAANGAPRHIVVREGGASEPAAQIAPDITPAEATRERQNAEQWLGSADAQLKRLAARTLDARQQETVGQIRNYMDGARSALKEGDVRRASTLAKKAQLLSDDLVKHYK